MSYSLWFLGDASENVRDWLYGDDHARALRLVLQEGVLGVRYNTGGENERRNIAAVRTIYAILDELRPDPAGKHDRLVTYVTDRPGHDFCYAIDACKLHRELGWTPQEDFTSGIRKTVAWYLENTRCSERVTSGTYRGERLGALNNGSAA